jgi:hypothetical protein
MTIRGCQRGFRRDRVFCASAFGDFELPVGVVRSHGLSAGDAVTQFVAAEGGRSDLSALRRAASARRQDQASISRQEQTMLWVRACHRATALTFSRLRTRNCVNPRLRA